jgi:hypothetical protein
MNFLQFPFDEDLSGMNLDGGKYPISSQYLENPKTIDIPTTLCWGYYLDPTPTIEKQTLDIKHITFPPKLSSYSYSRRHPHVITFLMSLDIQRRLSFQLQYEKEYLQKKYFSQYGYGMQEKQTIQKSVCIRTLSSSIPPNESKRKNLFPHRHKLQKKPSFFHNLDREGYQKTTCSSIHPTPYVKNSHVLNLHSFMNNISLVISYFFSELFQ